MIENNLIKKMAVAISKKHKSALADRNIMHPEREWFIGILLSLVVLMGGVAWSVFEYLQFSEVSIDSVENPKEITVYKGGLVKDALSDYQIRKKNYEDLKKQLLGGRIVADVVVEPTPDIVVSEAISSSTENLPVEVVEEGEFGTPTLSI